MPKSTERFTQTVDNYIKYRPTYPPQVRQLFIDQCGLKKTDTIADVGSGTGFLTKLFLEHGNEVYGVEPNEAMRNAADYYLEEYPNYHSIDGTAEATTLNDESVDFIMVGTAFHWFDIEKTKIEFKRILKANGWVALIWNVRDQKKSPLLKEYENLIIKYGTDYKESKASEFNNVGVEEFFHPHEMLVSSFENKQKFTWDSLMGRLLSTSYSLRPGDRYYDLMMRDLKTIFLRYQTNGFVDFPYETKVYYGHL